MKQTYEHVKLGVHEPSLLRRWNRVRGWLKAEDRDREQLLLLARAARDAGLHEPTAPLAGLTLDTLRKWREQSKPDVAWAGRYGVDFKAAEGYLDWSLGEARKKANRWRFLLIGIFVGVLLAAVAMTVLWLSARHATLIAEAQTQRAKNALSDLAVQSGITQQALGKLQIESVKTQSALDEVRGSGTLVRRSS